MIRFLRFRAWLACGLLALASSGCDEDVTYSYFAATVTVDRASVNQDLLDRVRGCAVRVLISARGTQDSANLQETCQRGRVGYDLGRVEYSSTVTTGTVQIVVEMKGLNDVLLASGMSQPIPVLPGKVAETSVAVMAVPQQGEQDASVGTDSGTAPDAGP